MSERDEVLIGLHQTVAELDRGIRVLTAEVRHYVRAPQQRLAMFATLEAFALVVQLQEDLVRRASRPGF